MLKGKTERNEVIAVFDLDGTLVETDVANSAAYRAAMTTCGVTVHGLYGRITASAIRAQVPGLSTSAVKAIVDAKVEAYCKELWRTRLGPAAESLKCVLLNRSAFAKIVLLTECTERRAQETLRHYGLVECFDEIVCNGGRGDKYANYFASHDTNPAACLVWENEMAKVHSAIVAGVRPQNVRKVG